MHYSAVSMRAFSSIDANQPLNTASNEHTNQYTSIYILSYAYKL